MNKQELNKLIRNAFRNTPYPKSKLTNTYDDEGVADFFSGKSWTGHSVSDLRFYAVAISFFEPEAFRYFLPAFMLAELEDPEEADIIGESIVFSFGEPADYWVEMYEARISLFTRNEKEAILEFLKFMGQDDCLSEYVTYASRQLQG